MDTFKTKITSLLDINKINYRILLHAEPVFTVETVAEQRGVIKKEIVKSILLCDKDGKYVMACVTGDDLVDPKAVRNHLPNELKRLHFAKDKEISDITGFVKGAVAPLGISSASFLFKLWIKPFKFYSGIFCSKLPVNCFVFCIAFTFPCLCF